MKEWLMGLLCCVLVVALAAPAALAQATDDDATKTAKEKYDALQKQASDLRAQMTKLQGKYSKDPEAAAARKASYDARKKYDEAGKASAAAVEAAKARDAARKQLAEAIDAAMAADSEAGPVFKKNQDAGKRLAAIKEEIKTLTEQRRNLRKELYTHERRISRDKNIAKDERAAASEAEKAYGKALKDDAAVQLAKKAADEARANYYKIRKAKAEADPEYAALAEKIKAIDKERRDLRTKMRPTRKAPKPKAQEPKAQEPKAE